MEEKVGLLEENLLEAGLINRVVWEERGRWQGGERILLVKKLLAIILQP